MHERSLAAIPSRLAVLVVIALVIPSGPLTALAHKQVAQVFQAGVAAVDITPVKLPVNSSGGFLAHSATVVHDRLFARCIVLDDGITQILFLVVDTLFVPRDLCDEVKASVSRKFGIAVDHILIAATHTHSGGCLAGCLGTDTDTQYVQQVGRQLVTCIERAWANLQPARIGWSSEVNARDTHCRVFIRRPDSVGVDPFGERSVRVMMHPGYQNPHYIGPSGPVDNQLSLLSVRSLDGKPLGVLANYSMHYFGSQPISADYFGEFSRILCRDIAGDDDLFVAMMSNGTSGDLHWMDYSQPKKNRQRHQYAASVAAAALRAYEGIEYHDWVELRVAQRLLKLDRRLPDAERWAWAKALLDKMDGRAARTQQEVYAREAKYLREEPTRELVLQAFCIGDLGIAALPTETYALTGLKLKCRVPMRQMFTIELANGAEGYIPPPEALQLGGYNAWPARSAGLQADAETIVTDTLLSMFEQLTGRRRKELDLSRAPYAQRVLNKKPLAYWRMGEMDGTLVRDISGAGHHGRLEGGYLFYLDGPARDDLRVDDEPTRAIQFVGGRMKANVNSLDDDYTVELFFWNGLPNDTRPVTGYLFSRGPEGVPDCPGDHLGISGHLQRGSLQGRLLFFIGDDRQEILSGGPVIQPKTWNHVRLVRGGNQVRVYLNFGAEPVISGEVNVSRPPACHEVFIGGRCDNFANFEGRIADVAVYRGASRN